MSKLLCLTLWVFCLCNCASTLACSCGMPPPAQTSLKSAKAVFVGTVTTISPFGEYRRQVTFDVQRTWKGVSGAVISLSTGKSEASCGVKFREGQKWLVYAYENRIKKDGPKILMTNICTRTRRFESAQADLKILGAGKVPSSKPTLKPPIRQLSPQISPQAQTQKTLWPVILLIGAASAVTGILLLKFRRR